MSVTLPGSSPGTGELLDGRYVLEARAGAGGMGIVYRARDEILGRTVAVKVFRDGLADASRMASETNLLAGLNHPALVTLYDAQLGAGQAPYLVMEFIDGPTLGEVVAKGALPSTEVARLACDLSEALHVVHEAGVVHRDIKPSNVLLRRSSLPGETYRAILADFGIAHVIDSTRLTSPGTLLGTAAYLSPEQVRGADPSPAGDIYSLGLVVLEALTGERAFAQQGSAEAALARLTKDPVIPGWIGYDWKALLTAMTARDPAQRPTALQVISTVKRFRDPQSDATDATAPIELEGATVPLGATVPPSPTVPKGSTVPLAATVPPGSTVPLAATVPVGSTVPLAATVPPGSTVPLAATVPVGSTVPLAPPPPASTESRRSRRGPARRRGPAVIALLVLAALVLGASVAIGALTAADPTSGSRQLAPLQTPAPAAPVEAPPADPVDGDTVTEPAVEVPVEEVPVEAPADDTKGPKADNPNKGSGNNSGTKGNGKK